MAQVNRIPLGFLDLIGAQTGGRNPPETTDFLSTTVDLTELYLGQTLSGLDFLLNHNAVADNHLFTVPSGEAWMIRAVSVNATLGSIALTERWAFGIQNLTREDPTMLSAAPFLWVSRELSVGIAGQVAADAQVFGQPFVLTPGASLAARLFERDAGPARDSRVQALVSRLR